MKSFTGPELSAMIGAANMPIVQRWLDRGDGVAVYRNHDFGATMFNCTVMMSYGSPAAQIEAAEPPEQMPDTGMFGTPWAYRLEGVARGVVLDPALALPEPEPVTPKRRRSSRR